MSDRKPATRRAATPKRRRDWKPTFLQALAETGMVTEACKIAKIGRRTAYDARQADETFALAWADVEELSTEQLEREAVRRAKDGSDVLLIFLLKSRRPDRYRDNVKVEHAGRVRHDHAIEVVPEDNRRLQVAQLLNTQGALNGHGRN